MECLEEIPDDEAATAVFADALRPGRPPARPRPGTGLAARAERQRGDVEGRRSATATRARSWSRSSNATGSMSSRVTPTTRGMVQTRAGSARPDQDRAAGSSRAGVSAADRSRCGWSGSASPGGRPARSTRRLGSRHEEVSRPGAGRAGRARRTAELLGPDPHVPERGHGRGGGRVGARPDAPAVRGRRLRRRIDRRHGRGAAPVRRPHRLRPARERWARPRRSTEAARRRRGEFVVVLDADDVFEPERIEALSELATARPDLDIVTTDAAWESEGRVVGRFNSEANPFEVEDQRAVILDRCFIVAPAVRRVRGARRRRAGSRARALRGLGLLDADDPRRVEGRLGRRAAAALPAARGKRQLEPAPGLRNSRRDARTSPDESRAAERGSRCARPGARRVTARHSHSREPYDAAHRGDGGRTGAGARRRPRARARAQDEAEGGGARRGAVRASPLARRPARASAPRLARRRGWELGLSLESHDQPAGRGRGRRSRDDGRVGACAAAAGTSSGCSSRSSRCSSSPSPRRASWGRISSAARASSPSSRSRVVMLLAGGLPLALTRFAGDALGRRRPGVVRGLARWVGRMARSSAAVVGAAIMVAFGLAGATPQAAWFLAAVVVAASLIQRVSVGRAQRAAEVASRIRRRRGHGRRRRCHDGPRALGRRRDRRHVRRRGRRDAREPRLALVAVAPTPRPRSARPSRSTRRSAATSCATPSSPRWA